jgi:FlaA1/EpsC-like NDP-sugar epimerase
VTRAARTAWTALIEHRFAWLAGWDGACWALALFVSTWGRYEFDISRVDLAGLARAMVIVLAVQLVAGMWQGLYLGRFSLGSFEEIAALLLSVALAATALLAADLFPRWVPISVPVVAPFVALVAMASLRYAWRLSIERNKRPSGSDLVRVLVFGAGEGGSQILTAMVRDPASQYLPVAIADDDPRKQHLRLRRVPVRGTRDDISRIAKDCGADTLLIAIPTASAGLVRELSERGAAARLKVLVVPPVADLLGQQIGVGDIRAVTEADLLGRREIDTDVASIAGYLTGKRVLITGAGGSIGAELCSQVHRYQPASLVMLDRDESALHAVQLSITGRAMLDTRNLVVGDIRDRQRMFEVFDEHRPEVVFHAAALKHLPLLEMHPGEGVKTNVWGTLNLLDATEIYGVETFVNISTDKAADPTSVLGCTKRIAERVTAAMSERSEATYLSVRFGNVLGSRGSVLTAFRSQIAAGGPITVTDPDVTRYFMTVEEAVQLVIQAGGIGVNGDVLILDMGAPVKILEVAKLLVEQSGKAIEIVFTGLRPGEKIVEVLLGSDERPTRSAHPLIDRAAVPPLRRDDLDDLEGHDDDTLVKVLRAMCDAQSSLRN